MEIASQLKIKLMEIYPEDTRTLIVDVLEENVKEIPLFRLDQEKNYGFSTYFCILPIEISKDRVYNVYNLLRIVKILRGPDGCPWDKKQTHHSVRQNVIEEAYEVVDAIDNEDIDNLVEELGDLLFQVIFHSELGSEEGYFNFNDVVNNVCKKMYSRHPHVFGDVKADNAEEALKSWESSKHKEKNLSTYTDNLKNVPKALSPLSRSYKIQKRAAEVGFDWPEAEGAVLKIKEELLEFIEEYNNNNIENMEEEFGDLLFALVNFARFQKINPDIALNKTINKFIDRFEYIEKNSTKDLKQMTLKEMDELWEESKFQ
jgi:tetrapyrrole methylase family protein/MazG family protein